MPVTGDKETIRNIRVASRSFSAREVDRISMTSLEPLRDMTATLAPRAALRSSVVTRRRATRGRGWRQYWVSFRRGLGMRIAHLIEFGTQPHSLRKGASVRKRIFIGEAPMHSGDRPEPFFRPAFEMTKGEVIGRFSRLSWELISRASRK